ncbi:MAG TPA: DUF448 domain-containing protein [Candidatus Sulfotelmatobacter sp.]|nr:DUF448 domain-containing protein [Candidatus Sulfotelmatobacter sp.]
MGAGGHVPRRTCIACRRQVSQRSLVRLVAVEGAVRVSLGPGAGRGAYVCASPVCLAGAAAGGRVGRALRADVTMPPADRLAAMVREAAERKLGALLGQGRRMRRVASGQEAVGERLGRRAASLLLLTLDAPAEGDRLAASAAAQGIPVARAFTREALGESLGVSPRWAAVVEDRQLAEGLRHYLGFLEGSQASAGPAAQARATRVGGGQGGRD